MSIVETGGAQTGEAALHGALAAHLAELRIDAEEYRVEVGGQRVEAPDPIAFRAQLTTALYEHWHAGTAGREAAPAHHRDTAFERELAAATPHSAAATPATLRALPDDAVSGQAVVEVNRVRVRVPAGMVAGSTPGDALVLNLPAVRPMLSPGFLFAGGSAGGNRGKEVLRMYVHLSTSEHAPAVWRALLEVLEGHGARYRAKVLSRRTSYPRRDAVVLYLPEESRPHVPDLVRAVEGLPGLGAATPVLARAVRPGLAMAWEPADERPGWRRVSFGQHRAMAVTRGIFRHMSDGVPLHSAVAEELTAAGVDPEDPARNLDSSAFPDPGAPAAHDPAGLAAVPA
ncbi:T3SS effector HopA1 family protein [Streptomyces sp. NBC_01190]|uniref:T3SS effector HopA1 family protein n=1 Tax=Streptomyces sp. NBC_01190 TaxID=2903767 RepID=UPI00386EBCEF|nr:T3SS effector HopA1 family protein [Streptomyces sp. NBC_01190]